MAKTQKDIEKYLNDLYDTVISNGKTHDEALAITSDVCKLLISPTISPTLKMVEEAARGSDFIRKITDQEAFSQSKIENTQLDKNSYKKALIQILEKWSKQAEKSLLPTNKSAQEIITIFANAILESDTEKFIIEPAIGTASLLLNINYNKILGFDINERLVTFARNLLELSNKDNEKIRPNNSLNKALTIKDLTKTSVEFITETDSSKQEANDIDDNNIWNNKGLFIFDPPIGNKMQKSSLLKSKTTDILKNSTENYVLSEVNFLLNFLAFAQNDSYCLCKMPSSFLTSRQRDLDTLREYIITNNLLALIKDTDNFIILFLQKKDESLKDFPLYAINYDSDLSDEIIKNIITQQDIDVTSNQNINKLTRSEILDELAGNIIPMPSSKIDVKKYEKPVYYFNQLVNYESDIKSQVITIGEKLLENKFIDLSEESNQNLKNLINDYYSIIPNIDFTEAQEEESVITTQENTDIQQYWFNNDEGISEVLKKSFIKIVPNYINKQNEICNLDPYLIDIKKYFSYLNILYKNNYLKYENEKLILSLHKEVTYSNSEDFEEVIKPEKYKSPNFSLNVPLGLISSKQKALYVNLCNYWFNYQENSNKDLFGEFPYAYITRTLKLFETLGLVICINNKQNYTNYYDMFRPYHPLIDDFEAEVI